VVIPVGSNTTIVGLNDTARILGAQLDVRGTSSAQRSNIIIRNITFQDTFDCFPAWAPTDGANGSWNAQYDAIAVRQTHHAWIDHNTFEDVATEDSTERSISACTTSARWADRHHQCLQFRDGVLEQVPQP